MTTDAKPLTKDEIEELEALERGAWCAPWTAHTFEIDCPCPNGEHCSDTHLCEEVEAREAYPASPEEPADEGEGQCVVQISVPGLESLSRPTAQFIVALRNAAPSLLASARAHASALARAEAAEAEAGRLRQQITDAGLCSTCHGHGTMGTGRPDAHGEGEEIGPCGACGGSGYASAEARTLERERDEARAERDEALRLVERMGVEAFMRGRPPEEIAEHVRGIVRSYERQAAAALSESASLRERVRALAEEWEHEGADNLDGYEQGLLHAASALRALLAPTEETTPAGPAKENDHE